MLRTLLRSKIHRARVTEANLDYEGSISVDPTLLEAASIVPFERVEIYDITNGNRLATYAIPGRPDSGEICINGAAARLVEPEDTVIICCYGEFADEEIADHRAIVVHVDERNRVTESVVRSLASARAGD